jgi:hypothetical protein
MQKIIMRRVYYSYALSIVSHAMFWQGAFLGVAAWLLAKWLHVASIIHNFLSVPVGSAPQYAWNSFWNAAIHGEFFTALTLSPHTGDHVTFVCGENSVKEKTKTGAPFGRAGLLPIYNPTNCEVIQKTTAALPHIGIVNTLVCPSKAKALLSYSQSFR